MNSAYNGVRLRILLALAVVQIGCMTGCARNLWFSTYTTIGVELQGEGEIPTAIRFAYKRFEGAIVPVDTADETAPVHSVLASINMSQWFWRTTVHQVFATGAAADIAAETEAAAGQKGKTGPFTGTLKQVMGGSQK